MHFCYFFSDDQSTLLRKDTGDESDDDDDDDDDHDGKITVESVCGVPNNNLDVLLARCLV